MRGISLSEARSKCLGVVSVDTQGGHKRLLAVKMMQR